MLSFSGHGDIIIWVRRKIPNKQKYVHIIKLHVNKIISHVHTIDLARRGRGLSPYASFKGYLLIKSDWLYICKESGNKAIQYMEIDTIDGRSVILVTYGWGWWQAQCPWWQSATWLSPHVQSAAVVHWPAGLLQWHKIIWLFFLFSKHITEEMPMQLRWHTEYAAYLCQHAT